MLLPAWYQHLTADARKEALDVVDGGDGWTDVDMVDKLLGHPQIPPQDLPKYTTCYFVEKRTPGNFNVPVLMPVPAQQAWYGMVWYGMVEVCNGGP